MDIQIFQRGHGETIIFVHGLVGNHQVFSREFESFSSHFHVIAYDYLGHGGRSLNDKPFTLPSLVEELHQVYVKTGIRKAHLCSLSFGSYIANVFAYQYPDLVASLCHIGGSFNGGFQLWQAYKNLWECRDQPYKQWIEQFSQVIAEDHQPNVEKSRSIFERHALTVDPSILYEAVRLRVFYDMRTILSHLHQPMLWVLGQNDPLYQSCLTELFKIVPHVQYVELQDALHVAHIFQPDQFQAEYRSFLHRVTHGQNRPIDQAVQQN
ncbi:MAG TPA: alpha/beta hydrolase [Bacillota bacterium]|nr:alpha/beta hydrolase [Bacillota bacterium]